MTNDPRRGLPSASAMDRLEACPASFHASKGLPDSSSEDAESGTRIHKALETGDASELSPDELDTFKMCLDQRQQIVEAWYGSDPGHGVLDPFLEVRLGLTNIGGVVEVTDETTATLRFTGQADVIALDGKRGLVIDYKTGRGDYEHATGNRQLRALAALAARRWRLDSVRVAIVQPWAGKPTVADFDAQGIADSLSWLSRTLERVKAATPEDLNAGEHCKWCRAKAVCPAFREAALAPVSNMAINLPVNPETSRAALFARAMELAPESLARLVRGLKLVGWYQAAIEGAARLRAESDVEFQQYFRLVPGNEVREITNAQAAFEFAAKHGVSTSAFMDCVKVGVGALEGVLREASGPKITKSGAPHKTQKAMSSDTAKTLVNTLEQVGALKLRQNAPQLEAVPLALVDE